MNNRIPAEALPKAAEPRAWAFAAFEFDLVRGELVGPAGTIALRPKADLLLRQFLAQPGRLLGRDELMNVLWPAAVVTDDSLVQVVGELRAALDDRDQQLIRTVPRRGYRFDTEPTAVWQAAPRIATAMPAPPPFAALPRPRSKTRVRAVLVGAALVLVAAAVPLWHWLAAPAPIRIDDAITARHVFAVMPFTVADGAVGLRDAADLVADQIAAQIGSRPGTRSIGRGKTQPLAGAPLSRLAEELNATYAITGRLAPLAEGRGLSVDVHLVAVASGTVIGSERFDLAPSPGPEAAADLGQQVMNLVRGRVGEIDVATATRPGHVPSAAELTMLGWDEVYRRSGPAMATRARQRFEAALATDPTSMLALNGLGAAFLQQRAMAVPLSATEIAAGERAIELALQRTPNDATAALLWGNLQTLKGRPELAVPAIEKSNRLVPGYANGHLMLARALLSGGRSGEVQPEIERAARLATLMGDTSRASAAWTLGAEAALMRHDDARALGLARRAVAEHPRHREAHAVLAAAAALAGHREEAASAMAAYRRMAPRSTVASYDDIRPSANAVYAAERSRFYEGLRQAGLPER